MNYDSKRPEKMKKPGKTKPKTKHRKKPIKTPIQVEIEVSQEKPNSNSNQKKIEEKRDEEKTEPKNNQPPEELILSSENSQSKENITLKKQYSYEYLIQFENMEKSKETDLLTEDVLNHISQIESNLHSIQMDHLLKINTLKPNAGSNCNTSKSSCSSFSNIMSLETWGRQDYTKETEEAENNKKIFEEFGKKDAIKKELRELLNILTKDNFEEIKIKILEIIKDNMENQEKFLDIIFLKSLLEKSYVAIYAKLIKDLNKELPQKKEKKSNAKKKPGKISTIFREKLLEKCKNILKFEEKNFLNQLIKEENEQEREIKMKKIILGDALFISELINIKILSKKAGCECIDYLFKKYNEGNNKKLKLINIQAIIIFLDKLGTLIQNQKEPRKEKNIKDNLILKEKIKETFEKLERIKKDDTIPGHIRYLIINLIEKKENNYEQSKFEKYIIAKSKKEIEEIATDIKEKTPEKETKEEIKEITQEEINLLIEKDLYSYRETIETEGSSENYSWNITTDLYDLKLKGFDSILEGYIISSGNFIEKKGNLDYAKSYVKELVEYYHEKMEEKEKKEILNKIVDLFEIVKDFSFETPDIYCLYEYVLELLIENEVIKMKDFEKKFEEKNSYKEDKDIICNIFQNIFKNLSNDVFKNELRQLGFINKQTNL